MRKIFTGFPIWFLLLVGVIVYFESSIPPDFCRSENRKLSDQEFIEIAVTYELNQGNLKLSESEKNASDFIFNHPNCCEVIRSSKKSIYSKIIASKSQEMDTDISIHLNYEANEFDPSSKKRINFHRFIKEYLDTNSCGQVIKANRMGTISLEVSNINQ